MLTIHLDDCRAALRAELRVTEDWYEALDEFGAPRWKPEQVQELVDDLEIEVGLADLDEYGELDGADCEAIMVADHSGLWDC